MLLYPGALSWSCIGKGDCFGAQKMSKRYQFVRERIVSPEGGFMEAFRMAIVDFTNLGERRFDLAGYPHASEQDALVRDWTEIGKDLKIAERKILTRATKELSRDRQHEPAKAGRDEQPGQRRWVG